jgi:predicted ribosomally synthesized peptide with SipW-like signal peptide
MKKIGFIILAVVLAVGLVGVAFAAWSSTLNVSGTLNTGNLSVVFYNSDVTADTPVGSSWCSSSEAVNGSGTATLTVVISNAYPDESVTVPFTLWNNGTVGTSEAWGTVTTNDATVVSTSGTLPGDIEAGYTGTGSVTINLSDSALANVTYTVNIPIVASQYSP